MNNWRKLEGYRKLNNFFKGSDFSTTISFQKHLPHVKLELSVMDTPNANGLIQTAGQQRVFINGYDLQNFSLVSAPRGDYKTGTRV